MLLLLLLLLLKGLFNLTNDDLASGVFRLVLLLG